MDNFDVALSFSGEDRALVEEIAIALRDRGLSVFYDQFLKVELWGEDLYETLDDVYRVRSRFTIIFISASYARKIWTSHERRSAQARALLESGAYILPIRIDDTELPGFRPTVSYLDTRHESIPALIDSILSKVAADQPHPVARDLVPSDHRATIELIGTRPEYWEHALFAGLLLQGKRELEEKWMDYEMRVSWSDRHTLPTKLPELSDRMQEETNALINLIHRITSTLNPSVLRSAFGPPGKPGDVDRITHLSSRLVQIYEALMDWSSAILAWVVPSGARTAIEELATLTDSTLINFRQLVDDSVTAINSVPENMARDGAVDIRLVWVAEIEPDAMAKYEANILAMRRNPGYFAKRIL